jgi:uncharacterized membrane protein
MKTVKVLFVGESYTANHTYIRGVDYVSLPEYGNTGAAFAGMLKNQGFEVEHLLSHDVVMKFPISKETLAVYDVVILSDVGSNTFLTNPPTASRTRLPNRLELLRRYVEEGGGLLMCGGYFSFSGVNNIARYGMTSLAAALPVEILNYDDRIEAPQGIIPEIILPEHPVLAGIDHTAWPDFCGYNKLVVKSQALELACFENDPFIVCMDYGEGRSVAFASDCEPN